MCSCLLPRKEKKLGGVSGTQWHLDDLAVVVDLDPIAWAGVSAEPEADEMEVVQGDVFVGPLHEQLVAVDELNIAEEELVFFDVGVLELDGADFGSVVSEEGCKSA